MLLPLLLLLSAASAVVIAAAAVALLHTRSYQLYFDGHIWEIAEEKDKDRPYTGKGRKRHDKIRARFKVKWVMDLEVRFLSDPSSKYMQIMSCIINYADA